MGAKPADQRSRVRLQVWKGFGNIKMLRLGSNCYAWDKRCYAWEMQKPLILLVCYAVTLGKAIFGGVPGGRFNFTESLHPSNQQPRIDIQPIRTIPRLTESNRTHPR